MEENGETYIFKSNFEAPSQIMEARIGEFFVPLSRPETFSLSFALQASFSAILKNGFKVDRICALFKLHLLI
jgi:hypothetical protein